MHKVERFDNIDNCDAQVAFMSDIWWNY